MNISNFELFKFGENVYTPFLNNKVCYSLNKSPHLDIVLTDKCNSNCKFCIADLIHNKLDCDLEVLKRKIFFAIVKMNVKEVLLLGGEPTVSKNLLPIIKFLKTQELDKIVVTSNGIRLANDLKFREELLSSGITHLNLSVMALDAVSQREISGAKQGINYNDLGNIYKLAKKYGVQVRISANVFKGNLDGASKMLTFYTQLQDVCDSVKFSPLFAVDDFSVIDVKTKWVQEHILHPGEYDIIFTRFEEFMEKQKDCVILENPKQFGFVKNTMIPLKTPIIMNWNFGKYTGMKDRVTEHGEINNIKLLPNGELSLSWNREETKYYIKTE